MDCPAELQVLLKKPVAILGYGVSGRAAAQLVTQLGGVVVVFDQNQESCDTDFNLQRAQDFSLVIYSPGISLQHPWLQVALKAGCVVLSEIDFAAAFWQGELIAITGTNGKTTTTKFLTEAFQLLGKQAIAVGNMGYPFSSLVCDKGNGRGLVAVCEMSSFQSQRLTYLKPDAVLWTNFAEDHLDYHADLREYFAAKLHLLEQSAISFVGESVETWGRQLGFELPAKTIVIEHIDAYPAQGVFSKAPQKSNYALVYSYWRSRGFDLSLLEEVVLSFVPLKHRMSLVAEIDGVKYWNDSKATNFDAVYGALKSFNEKVLWIGGGKDKGSDLAVFSKNIHEYIDAAYLIGQTGAELKELLLDYGIKASYFFSLEEAIDKANENSVENSNIILSPGFSSYDMFTGFEERGNCFEKHVLGLKKPSKCAS